jgi:hypothetical protein
MLLLLFQTGYNNNDDDDDEEEENDYYYKSQIDMNNNNELNGFSLDSYLILLIISLVWILVLFIFYDKLIAKLFVSLYLFKKINNNSHHIIISNLQIKSINISLLLFQFCIHLNEVTFSLNNVCHFECNHLCIQLLNLKSSKLFQIKLNSVTLICFNNNFKQFNLNFLLETCQIELNDFKMILFDNDDDKITIKVNRLVLVALNSMINLNINSLKINNIIHVDNDLRIQLFYQNNEFTYNLEEDKLIYPNYILNIISSNSKMFIYIDLWNKFPKLLLLDNNNLLIRIKMKSIHLCLMNSNDTLYKLNLNNISIEHYSRQQETICNLDHLSLDSILMHNQLFEIDTFKIKILYTNNNNNKIEIDTQAASKLSLNLLNIELNLELINLLKNQLLIIIDEPIMIDLNGRFESIEIHFMNSLQININEIQFKYYNNELLINLNNNLLFDYENEEEFNFFSEKISIEYVQSKTDFKLQLLVSPIIFGENNLDPTLDTFVPFNLLFLNVVQIRVQSFYSSLKCLYSKQIEIIIGDLFGSIDLQHFSNLIQFIDLINDIYLNESNSKIDSLSNCYYHSFRLITSLVHVNLFELHLPINNDLNSICLNLILKPFHYASCSLHPGLFYLLPELNLTILGSSNMIGNNKNNTLDLVECGSICLKYSNNAANSLPIDLDSFKLLDSENNYLNFLWSSSNECSCTGKCEFFSYSNMKLNDLTKDFVYKPCVYWFNTTSNNKTFGFGQSILIQNEISFYSYKNFFKISPNINNNNNKLIVTKVLSHIEINNFEYKKFEPLEIGIYNTNELNKFLNDNINLNDIKMHSFDILTSNFNSANMSPPYFSNEFSIYIRYLPTIRFNTNNPLYPVYYSDVIDYDLTDKILKQLDLFDTKLLKDTDSFLNNNSTPSLNKIESNLSIANLSLNDEESIHPSLSLNSLISNNEEEEEKEKEKSAKFKFNLNQIYTGYKLTSKNIQHLKIESILKLNNIQINPNSGNKSTIILTPLSIKCIEFIHKNNYSFNSNFMPQIISLNVKTNIKFISTHFTSSVEIDSISLNTFNSITFSDIVINLNDKLLQIPELTVTNSIRLEIKLTQISSAQIIPIECAFLFTKFLSQTCNDFILKLETFDLIILKIDLLFCLTNNRVMSFHAGTVVNCLNKILANFKLNFKLEFILKETSLILIDCLIQNMDIQAELTCNSLLNETNKYLANITLPSFDFKDNNDLIEFNFPALMCVLSQNDKNISNIYQLTEFIDLKLVIFKNSIHFDCNKLRHMQTNNKLNIDLFKLIRHFFEIKDLNNNTFLFEFKSNESQISYYLNGFNNKWYLLNIKNLELNNFKIKLNDNLIMEEENRLLKSKNGLKIRKNILLLVNNSNEIFKRFEFKKWLDYSGLNNSLFKYNKIQLITMCDTLNLDLEEEEESQLMKQYLYIDQKLADDLLLMIISNGTDSLATTTNQFVGLIHKYLLEKYKNMFLLIDLIKRT